jgi:hypothetical protein
MSTPTTGACAYCGAIGTVTDDHIPPRNLFAPPRVGLITVPCCERCRNGTWLDDEYLRIALSRRDDARAHPSLAALQPDIDRSLQRPEAPLLAARIERETEPAHYTTAEGLIVPGLVITPDFFKIARVMERITRGLYFREQGRPLPEEFQVTIGAEPRFAEMDDILRRIRTEPKVVIGGGGEFIYQWGLRRRASDNAEASVWLLTFYDAVQFCMLVTKPTGPPDNFWLRKRD